MKKKRQVSNAPRWQVGVPEDNTAPGLTDLFLDLYRFYFLEARSLEGSLA